jgi:hypothetical protein
MPKEEWYNRPCHVSFVLACSEEKHMKILFMIVNSAQKCCVILH